MLKDLSRARLAGAWCAALIVIGAVGVVFGAEVSVSNIELWLVAWVVPSVVMLLAWRGAPARTVAEVLYAVDSPSKEARP
jgi:hypothetical protein